MGSEEPTLFDPPGPTRYPDLSKLSAGRRATIRRRAKIAKGFHPVTHKPLLKPLGDVCKGCAHYRDGRYKKCLALNGAFISSGPATDLRASDPACVMFRQQKDEPNYE